MPKEKPKTSPRDFFLHLLAIVTLYIAAFAFGRILFLLINYYFPDPLDFYGFYEFFSGMRWAVASLIISLPAYLLVARSLQKQFHKDPNKKDLRVRQWLTYFTIFGTAVIILTSLISILFRFLGGELTIRFVFKVATVLYISGLIFGYYLYDVRTDKTKKNIMISMAGIAIASSLAAVIAGFFLMGSPSTQRAREFDQQRVEHISTIQSAVIGYYGENDELPVNLQGASTRFYQIPRDPETGESYEYNILGEKSFEVCAKFNTEKPDRFSVSGRAVAFPRYEGMPSIYESSYEPGRNCFPYTIEESDLPPKSGGQIREPIPAPAF